jgi:ribosomal protein S18 acetylase RimI-like enzyme
LHSSLYSTSWSDFMINPAHVPLVFREASLKDLEAIIALLFEDQFGQTRENPSTPLSASYLKAFSKISGNPNDELLVAELNHQVIGVMQITYLQHLTFQGGLVAHIEGVRIKKEHQKKGFGQQMFQWAIKRAKNQGCHRIQLMTDKRRSESKKFYEQLGFSATHEGMKLYI